MRRHTAARIILDYSWLFAAIWAAFGGLVTGLVLRKLDISRASYNEARQLLSAMVSALSVRIQKTEVSTRQLSEQIKLVKANQTRSTIEDSTTDKIKLLEYVQEWAGNVKHFVHRLNELETNLTKVDAQLLDLRTHVDLVSAAGSPAKAQVKGVGTVTGNTIAKLSETERQVLLLLYEGSKDAPEIGKLAERSREHTARLMKTLFEQGFVERETHRQPYRYTLNEKVREVLSKRAAEASIQSEVQT